MPLTVIGVDEVVELRHEVQIQVAILIDVAPGRVDRSAVAGQAGGLARLDELARPSLPEQARGATRAGQVEVQSAIAVHVAPGGHVGAANVAQPGALGHVLEAAASDALQESPRSVLVSDERIEPPVSVEVAPPQPGGSLGWGGRRGAVRAGHLARREGNGQEGAGEEGQERGAVTHGDRVRGRTLRGGSCPGTEAGGELRVASPGRRDGTREDSSDNEELPDRDRKIRLGCSTPGASRGARGPSPHPRERLRCQRHEQRSLERTLLML